MFSMFLCGLSILEKFSSNFCTLAIAVFASTMKRRDSPMNIVEIILRFPSVESNAKTLKEFISIPEKIRARTEINPAMAVVVKKRA